MKKCIKYFSLAVLFFLFSFIYVNAKEMTSNDIPVNSYVIGKHVFTENISLSTSHIMLAAKTIENNDISEMIIYYKTPRGKWINGATGESLTVPESFEINYTDLQLEEENSTVSVPKEPILYLDGPLSIEKETDIVTYSLNIFIDDIVDTNNKVDGVEITYDNGTTKTLDFKYGDKFTGISTILDNFKGEGLIVGNSYHSDSIFIENYIDQYIRGNVRAYVLDGNGKKVYSDFVLFTVTPDDNLPELTLINEYSNPDYVSNSEGFFNYRLGINELDAYMFKISPEKFAYLLSVETEAGAYQLGKYGIDEKVTVAVPENSVRVYKASLGYYNVDGDFIFQYSDNEFIIDTRTLTAPILNVNQDGFAFSDLKRNGEYLRINSEFYEEQKENTLDNHIEGAEIYRVYHVPGSNFDPGYKTIYELISSGSNQKHVFPPKGAAYYTARVYATNAEGKKVYSDFSNIEAVVRTPEIEVSEVNDGKVDVSIVNKEQYDDPFSFNVYTWNSNDGEVLIDSFTLSDGQISIDVIEDVEIYVRARGKDYESSGLEPVYVYSAKSNKVNIVAE